ncbi:unnamed protein product [Auanema sp. JU1783]|nr:unnamed protein product [Auanema sp. JU1783]
MLFDSSTEEKDLNWITWPPSTSESERSGWMEETWAGIDEKSSVRIYGSCSLDSLSNHSHWVFVPPFSVRKAKGVFVDLLYTIRSCGSGGPALPCKETVNVHVREFNREQYRRFKNRAQDYNVSQPEFARQWAKRHVLTMSQQRYDQVTFMVSLKPDTEHIQLAFDDNGACASVLVTKVFYTQCERAYHNFTIFESTIANTAEAGDNVMVHGTCVPNSSAVNMAPVAFCKSSGEWGQHIIGNCECDPGYTAGQNNDGEDICKACPSDTFKSDKGDKRCERCPANSSQMHAGGTKCTCYDGYHRAPEEPVSAACSQPPSEPIAVIAKVKNDTSVELLWDEPHNLGFRSEIWYEVECHRGACTGISVYPSMTHINSRFVVVRNLEPESSYTFHVIAKNKVSSVAKNNRARSQATVSFSTPRSTRMPVTSVRVDAELSGGVVISWHPPESEGTVRQYEIEITSPTGKKILSSDSPSLTVSNLRPGHYTFKVRADQGGWGQWSEPLQYDYATRDPVGSSTGILQPETTALQAIPPWVLGLSTLLLMILLAFMLLICRRNTRNRKQMSDLDVLDTYKQDTMTPDYSSGHRQFNDIFRSAKINAPLIPSYGTSVSQPPPYYGNSASKFKPYVDPTAYEDPNQALTEFTYDIDPAAVFITHVIGGGEFGDVCMGGLKRNILGDQNVEGTETVAIKTLKPGSSAKAKADFLLEASIMGQFCHPNVVRLIGVVTRAEPAMIVTEYMENGSLDNFLRGKDAQGFEIGWPHVVNMLRGIASGMKYLTDKGYVHRDLAARNVLVDSAFNCKIADFGLSRGVDDTAAGEYTTNGGKIPVRWTAPEAITHRKFTAASDVWSFGVLTWEVCSFGERPYWDWTNQKVISEIMAGYRLPAPMDCPASLHRIMLWCWKLERHDRPSFAQLLAILEKYSRNPEYIYTDSSLVSKYAYSTNHLENAYGAVRPPGISSQCPPPPSGSPPTYPQLDDFLRSLGMGHTSDKLNKGGVFTVSDLSRRGHLDLLAMGLITEEFQRIRDALHQLQLARGLSRPDVQQATMPHRARTLPRKEEGFFV